MSTIINGTSSAITFPDATVQNSAGLAAGGTIATGTVTTLTTTTISDGTNSTSATNCIQGSAKAWVNFNGVSGSVAINASYNISSLTRNSTGDYTLSMTNALADNKYCICMGCGNSDGGGSLRVANIISPTTTSSVFRIQTVFANTSLIDVPNVYVSIFR